MPEGDTIAKLSAYLRPRLEGQVLADGQLRGRPHVRFEGRRVLAVEPHGKHLFVTFEDGDCLRSHLGMWGTWHRYAVGERWKKPRDHASVWFATSSDVYACFHPMEVELGDASRLRTRQRRRLGDDLVRDPAQAGEELALRARSLLDPEDPVVDLLLDQRIAAGVGNVYKSETLFLERIEPDRAVGRLTEEELERLFVRARDLIGMNLIGGPRVTRMAGGAEPLRAEGGKRLWVYGRQGWPCFRCGTRIRRLRMGRGHRSTYWCPACQGGS